MQLVSSVRDTLEDVGSIWGSTTAAGVWVEGEATGPCCGGAVQWGYRLGRGLAGRLAVLVASALPPDPPQASEIFVAPLTIHNTEI